MSKLQFNTKFEFDFWKGEGIFYKLQLSLLSPRGLEMINSMGGGGYGRCLFVPSQQNCRQANQLWIYQYFG